MSQTTIIIFLLGVLAGDGVGLEGMDELEKEGKIRQVGKTGRHVYYEKT